MDADRITDLAAAVADGLGVDWAEMDRLIGDDERELLAEFQVIAAVSAVHAGEPPGERPAPKHWGPLTLLERIGCGCFGDVFRARDPRLERDVALKLLRRGSGSLVSEGRSLARIHHPNVVTVHGADEHDGRAGLWMELVRGRTLQHIVEMDGALGEREALGVAIDICRALAAVHQAGVLHRDVKPANVMRGDGGRIVLMDFGTSRDAGHLPDDDSAGTPLYLAPELLDGGRASPRSDVFSVGALLFFVVTGQRFTDAESLTALRAAHATGQRRLLRDVRADLSERIVRIVERATASNPDERFQSAGAMEAELVGALGGTERLRPRWYWSAALAAAALAALIQSFAFSRTAPAPPLPTRFESVAVLPFASLSSETPEYLIVGINDALIREIARVEGIRVISRTTALQHRQRNKPVPQLARDLGVRAVVEGSIRIEGLRLFLEARLVDAVEDRTVWSTQRAGTVTELPRLERSLSQALVERLAVRPPKWGDVPSPTAYEHYLKGRAEWNKRTPAGLTAARQLFEASIAESPLFADAQAGLAATYLLLGAFDVSPKTQMFARARAAADRALHISDEVAEAHAVRAYILYDERQVEASHREFRRAIELDPSNATARQWYALTLLYRDSQAAINEIRIAHDLDPLSMPITSDLAVIYRHTGQLKEAIRHLTRTVTTFPEFPEGHRQLGWALEADGRYAEAAQAFTKAVAGGATAPENLASIGYNLAMSGDMDGSKRMLARLQELRRVRDVGFAHDATLYTVQGDLNSAIAALQRAAEPVSEFQTFVGRTHERPPLAALWNDPRFVTLVASRTPWLVDEKRERDRARR